MKEKGSYNSMISCTIHIGRKFILPVILIALLDAFVTLHALPIAVAADAPQSVVRIDEQRLIWRWVRPDGGYTLELKEIGKDGKLKAAYYNPRPINVSKAEISHKDGGLTIFIELRDMNYPGSKYNLRYDARTDRLTGTYFQAVQGEIYDVEFVRAK